MWIILYLLVIFCSLTFIPANVPDMFWIPKEMIYTLFGFSVIASTWIGRGNKRIVYKNLWAGILLIYIVASFCWHFYSILMFPPAEQMIVKWWNLRPTLNIILGLILIQTLVEYTDSLKRWIILSKVICWLCGIFSCYALLQWCGIDQIFGASDIKFMNKQPNKMQLMVTFMSNKFLTGCFLAMTAPLCLMFKNYKYKIIYGLSFLAICLTDTTTPLIAFIFSLVAYLIFFKRFKILSGLIVLGGIFLWWLTTIRVDFLSGTGRIPLWKNIITIMIERDLGFLGNGIGSFGRNFSMDKLMALSAHNEFIQMFWEGGIALLIIFVAYMIHLMIRSVKYLKSNYSTLFICYVCALLSSLVVAFNGFPLRIAPLALFMVLYITSLETQIQGENYL